MKKNSLVILFIFLIFEAEATIKNKIILSLEKTNNISFDFEQNINGKIENGSCILQYPKKIFCKYNLNNQKILISNGNSLVIKTLTSFYLYPLSKTPLEFILNKDFLLDKISSLNERTIDNKFINYTFFENENEINIFFDRNNYNLIGWQTTDIYQNLSITYISNINKNINIKDNLFNLPNRN